MKNKQIQFLFEIIRNILQWKTETQYVALAEDLSNVETKDVRLEPVISVFTQPLTSCATGIHPVVGTGIHKLFPDTSNHQGNFCLKVKLPQLIDCGSQT